jgi:hypothetical protein
MGQINLSRITTTASIIKPPVGVDAIYNFGGTYYSLDSNGITYSLIRGTIDGIGNTNYLTKWDDNDTIGQADILYSGGSYSSAVLAGLTNSCLLVGDADGSIYNSNIMIKQIAVTVSSAEILNLYTTPKVLVARAGTGTVLQVISAYVKNNGGSPYAPANLVIFEGGNGATHECEALSTTSVRRYRFIPRNTSAALVQTQDDDGDITLSADAGNPTGGNSDIVIYLTYTYYDESSF